MDIKARGCLFTGNRQKRSFRRHIVAHKNRPVFCHILCLHPIRQFLAHNDPHRAVFEKCRYQLIGRIYRRLIRLTSTGLADIKLFAHIVPAGRRAVLACVILPDQRRVADRAAAHAAPCLFPFIESFHPCRFRSVGVEQQKVLDSLRAALCCKVQKAVQRFGIFEHIRCQRIDPFPQLLPLGFFHCRIFLFGEFRLFRLRLYLLAVLVHQFCQIHLFITCPSFVFSCFGYVGAAAAGVRRLSFE